MAVIDTTRAVAQDTLVNRAGKTLFSLIGAIAAWNDARITRNALSKLSARELDDIGLVPGDIEDIAVSGRQF